VSEVLALVGVSVLEVVLDGSGGFRYWVFLRLCLLVGGFWFGACSEFTVVAIDAAS
jgi:hypothetical protein